MDILKKIDITTNYMSEETEYQKFFKKKLAEYKVKSPAELSTEDKKKFFNDIEKSWTKDKDKD